MVHASTGGTCRGLRSTGGRAASSASTSHGNGQESPNVGCILEVVARGTAGVDLDVVSGYRPAVLTTFPSLPSDDGAREAGTRYVFTALHRNRADLETNRSSGFQQGTAIAVDQLSRT